MAKVGDRVPDVEVRVMGETGAPVVVRTGEVLGSGKVVLFGLPGAFTPGCSRTHLPGYVANADQLRERGVDTIACVSVNDAYVMEAWSEAQGADGKVLMLADGSAEFTRAMDLVLDLAGAGMGVRSQRYSAVIEDGVITSLDVEPGSGISVSACEVVLEKV